MKTPSSGNMISKAWLEEMLSQMGSIPSPFTVQSFTITGIDPGEGLNSELVLIRVEVSQEKNCESDTEGAGARTMHHLVAKFLSRDPVVREMGRKMKVPQREYVMYSEIIPYLNQKLENAAIDTKVLVPHLIYGKCSYREYVLLLENIQPLGYKTNDRHAGLDFQHLKAAVKQIAVLHAVTYVCHKNEDLKNKYPALGTTAEYMNAFEPMVTIMLENCEEYVRSLDEMADIGEKINIFKKNAATKCMSAISDSSITCLNHGDFWNNNLMYKYAEKGEEQHIDAVKLIDLGNCSLGSPMFDLQYLMHTSTTRTVRDAHLDDLLHHYHSTFTTVTHRFNATPAHWTFDHLKAEWDKTYVIGFCMGVALTQGTLSNDSKLGKPEDDSRTNVTTSSFTAFGEGIKSGLAKLTVQILSTSAGKAMMKMAVRKITKPIIQELKSGKNEIMNSRLIDLIQEANEKGLFNEN